MTIENAQARDVQLQPGQDRDVYGYSGIIPSRPKSVTVRNVSRQGPINITVRGNKIDLSLTQDVVETATLEAGQEWTNSSTADTAYFSYTLNLANPSGEAAVSYDLIVGA